MPNPGPELSDGDRFLVLDRKGLTETFEIESGYTLVVPQTLTLIVPEAGGVDITDGNTFTVRRIVTGVPARTAVFEFDSDGVFIDNNLDKQPDNYLIKFKRTSTREELAALILEQLISANIGLSPKDLGDGVVHLWSVEGHSVDRGTDPVH